MTLSLVSPVSTDFIKDYPAQNGVNCDAIDAYAGPCLTSDALQTYTPALHATTTDPSLGAGTIKGWYYQIFDQIFAWGEFRFGSGFSAGTGVYLVTLPFLAQTTLPQSINSPGIAAIVGTATTRGFASNANKLPLTAHLSFSSPGMILFGLRGSSGQAARELRDSNYMTWAASEGVSWNVRYKRAT